MRYFEDLAVGKTWKSPKVVMTPDKIKAFAAEFDPQPFHMDEGAAKDSFFGGLVASGWHTAAMAMRMLVEAGLDLVGGAVGLGVEELRWPRPVYAGDELEAEVEVTELRASRSKPGHGIVKVRVTTFNQRGEIVQISRPVMIVPRRDA
jgi:acyl dehydratase